MRRTGDSAPDGRRSRGRPTATGGEHSTPGTLPAKHYSRALPKKGKARLAAGASLVAIALVIAFALVLLSTHQVSPAPAAGQGNGTSAQDAFAAATATTGAAARTPAVPKGSPPLRISYPATGMDQTILPLTPPLEGPESGTVDPPLTLDAYWLTPFGSPGPDSTNTTYIIGHSWEDRTSAFNNLSTRAHAGDKLTLTTVAGEISYTVTAVTTEDKDTLKDSSIWAKVPRRLVIISCYTQDLWGKNIIISADPTPSHARRSP